MSVYIDAHAHWYPEFDPAVYLDAAAAGFDAARKQSGGGGAGVLLLADPPWVDSLERLRGAARGWRAERDAEGELVLRGGAGEALVLLAGRQRVSSEGIEVLSLASAAEVDGGRAVSEMVREIAAMGGVPVVPWGFGKWWGRRGRLVRGLIEQPTAGFFLGDSRGRVVRSESASIFATARRAGVPVLAGSDPLPLVSQARVAGRFGSMIEGDLDLSRPGESLRGLLKGVVSTPPRFGARASVVEFAAGQWALRAKKQRGANGGEVARSGLR